jgi:hypothetical protein
MTQFGDGAARGRRCGGTRAHTVPKFYLNGFIAPGSATSRDPFVWIGSLKTGEISRRSPKNISLARGLYDGQGGFAEPDATVEAHLAKIESAASTAIRKFAAEPPGAAFAIPPEIGRFLAWQAARTPGWMKLEEDWAREFSLGLAPEVLEPPPPGFEKIGSRERPMCVENPSTGERREVVGQAELITYCKQGWKWILSRQDLLELLHLQAWYFQVRHFPRLSWARLTAPRGDAFITSDRGVSWLVDGFADTPPAALRDPKAQLVAPLTRTLALVGRHSTDPLNVTPREVNRFVAFAASEWIAGPSLEVVQRALEDRYDPRH